MPTDNLSQTQRKGSIHSPLHLMTAKATTAYVRLMLQIIGRALVAASKSDGLIKQELQGYPSGFTIGLGVMPNARQPPLGFTVQVQDHGTKRVLQFVENTTPAELSLQFKHVNVAFLVVSFQESTAQAFANDRMIADGDLAYAIRFVRLLNQLEALILPKVVATRAIKRYPDLTLQHKLRQATSIYLSVVQQMGRQVLGSQP